MNDVIVRYMELCFVVLGGIGAYALAMLFPRTILNVFLAFVLAAVLDVSKYGVFVAFVGVATVICFIAEISAWYDSLWVKKR